MILRWGKTEGGWKFHDDWKFNFQTTSKKIASQTDALVKDQSKISEEIAKKLSKGGDASLSGALDQLKIELKELLSKGGSGGGALNQADRVFFQELTNDTKTSIYEIKNEILKSSDESKLIYLKPSCTSLNFESNFGLNQRQLYCRQN